MPIKEITINKNKYKVVCKEGQEQHLIMLANKLNTRINHLQKHFEGKCSELTLLLLAALELEDQLYENKTKTDSIVNLILERINRIIFKLDGISNE